MLLILPILPVQLIAFHFIRTCRLNGVVAESNQVELRLVAPIGRLRLSLGRWRVLLLVLGLLLGRRSNLPLLRRRVALLITVILLWGGRRVVAAIVSIRIVAVSIGIVAVPVSRVAIVVGVATES